METKEDIRTLLEEIRLQLHLARMDSHDWWEEVEHPLQDLETRLEKRMGHLDAVAEVVGRELTGALQRIRDELAQQIGTRINDAG